MVHSTELKFGMYVTGHCLMNPIDFGECQMYSFFTEVHKRIVTHRSLWNQIL